jgi:hypothetical protein
MKLVVNLWIPRKVISIEEKKKKIIPEGGLPNNKPITKTAT